jgi:hypothetical protein
MVGQSARIQVDNHSDILQHPTGAVHTGTPCSLTSDVSSRSKLKRQHAFRKRQKLQPGQVHKPIPCLVRGKGDVSGRGSYCRFKKCPGVIIWISASYLEHIPMIPMKCMPPYLSYISHILSTYL